MERGRVRGGVGGGGYSHICHGNDPPPHFDRGNSLRHPLFFKGVNIDPFLFPKHPVLNKSMSKAVHILHV